MQQKRSILSRVLVTIKVWLKEVPEKDFRTLEKAEDSHLKKVKSLFFISYYSVL